MGDWTLKAITVHLLDPAGGNVPVEVPIHQAGALFWNADGNLLRSCCGWEDRHFSGSHVKPRKGGTSWAHTNDLEIQLIIKDPLCSEPPEPISLAVPPNAMGWSFDLEVQFEGAKGSGKSLHIVHNQLKDFAGLVWEVRGRGPNKMIQHLAKSWPAVSAPRPGHPNPLRASMGLVFFLDAQDFRPYPFG